jgi:hypothetical protein
MGRLRAPLQQSTENERMNWDRHRDDSVFVLPIRLRTQDLSTLTSIVLILRSDHVRAIISDRSRLTTSRTHGWGEAWLRVARVESMHN